MHEQLHVKKFKNVDEMDKFSDRHKLSNVTQKEIKKNLKSPIYILKKFNLKLNTSPLRKFLAWVASLVNSVKDIREKKKKDNMMQKL